MEQPALRVDPFIAQSESGRWLVTWRVTNLGPETLHLVSARQPHSQFHTDEVPLAGEIAPAATTEVTLPVAFAEPAGSVIENPFLILLVSDRRATWRIFARVRVRAGDGGEPIAGSVVTVSVGPARDVPT